MYIVLDDVRLYTCTYIDDTLVYSHTWTEHLQHVEETLARLDRAGFTVNPAKCVWGSKAVEFVGHMVGGGRVSVPEARVGALMEFVRPKGKKGLRAFLGTAGYYRRFIPHYSGKGGPLFSALRKGEPEPLEWSEDMCQSFKHLTHALAEQSKLFIPTSDDDLELHTDASTEGLRVVLTIVRG